MRLAMMSCSSTDGGPSARLAAPPIASLNTFGISSGLFSIDNVVAVMKYHELRGRDRDLRIEDKKAGVMIEFMVDAVEYSRYGLCAELNIHKLFGNAVNTFSKLAVFYWQ